MVATDLITQREQDVLYLLCEGFTAKEISARLHISTYTVETHKKNLIEKFHSRNTVHMVVKALGRGIIAH